MTIIKNTGTNRIYIDGRLLEPGQEISVDNYGMPTIENKENSDHKVCSCPNCVPGKTYDKPETTEQIAPMGWICPGCGTCNNPIYPTCGNLQCIGGFKVTTSIGTEKL